MQSHLKIIAAWVLRMLAIGLVTTPVWSDDTEIFFGDVSASGAAPNVLFIMDTSGSMGNTDGTGRSRIDRVKDALKQLLGSLNNVNVGLMRFSNPGGPVLYPVTYIDQAVGQSTEDVTVTATVSDSNGDAYEALDSGSVTVDAQDLRIGGVPTGAGGDYLIERRIEDEEEDAIQAKTGTVYLSGQAGRWNGLILNYQHDYIGLRFPGMEIPRGAEILSATLELTSRTRWPYSGGDVTATVQGELPPAPDFKEENNNISERFTNANNATSATVAWPLLNENGRRPGDNERITSPELATIVQEIIDDDQWEGDAGDSDDILLGLFFADGEANRRYRYFESFERDENKAPRLTVRYTTGPVETEPYMSGMRFDGVDLPQGVTVTSANIKLVPLISNDAEASITVAIEDAASPAPYTNSTNNLSSRTTGDSVTWNSDANEWRVDRPVEIDVTSLVNNHAQRTDWCGGDSMAFNLAGDGVRFARSFDENSSVAPKIEITYERDTIVPGASCRSLTERKSIVNDADDGQSSGTGSAVSTRGNSIEIDGSNFGLFRFTGLNIPANADVTSAYLRLVSAADTSGATNLNVSITANADNAGDANGVSTRAFVGNVPWTITDDWEDGTVYRSPDIQGLIDSVLNGTWSAGDDMLLRVRRTAGSGRTVGAYDSGREAAAQLVINYVDDGTRGAFTVRDEIIEVVDSLSDDGYTPVQDTYYEAYQYYTGGDVVWGKYRGGNEATGEEITVGEAADGPFNYARVSAKAAIVSATWGGRVLPSGCPSTNSSDRDCNDSNGAGKPKGEYLVGTPEYRSPITSTCASNHIIMLTDGIANEPHSEAFIKATPGVSTCQVTDPDDADVNAAQACVLELADYMSANDLSPLDGKQTVFTHTIGFNFSSDWLREVAEKRTNEGTAGVYKEAGSAQDLLTTIKTIFRGFVDDDSAFVAPVAAVNNFNRLTNLDDVYFAVFRPENTPRWPGNLKKYKLGEVNGESNVLLSAPVSDNADPEPAVDPATGFFAQDSRSYWSDTNDGPAVKEGGAASKIPAYDNRKVYTYLGSDADLPANLASASNAIATANNDLTAQILGVPSNGRDEHIAWIRGQDVDDENSGGVFNENRYVIGDPLHSKPVAVSYDDPEGANPGSDTTLYMGTNGGGIHAFDAATGVEVFAFLPKEIFPQQRLLRENASTQQHVYGIDGSITAWRNDAGSDGITAGGDDFVRLYVGQRRGGRNLYALDVTNREAPKLLWQIEGGQTTGFAELGQTWSQPILGRIKYGTAGQERDVLFFAGGYDPLKDSFALRAPDTQGRAVYIVDAVTGDLLWSGGPPAAGFTKEFPDMQYSIPASLAVADTDNDGIDNVIFVGDTGGQLWRFDINAGVVREELISGGVIADFAGEGDVTESENRTFFHSPDVAVVNADGTRKLAVSIGSGKRPNPLGKAVTDQFYMVLQNAVYGAPASYGITRDDGSVEPLTQADLYDATSNAIVEGEEGAQATAKTQLDKGLGWFFDLPDNGEKVLSTPLTLADTIIFTTYVPENIGNSCAPKAGTSYVYQVNVGDATPTNNWDDIDGLTVADRRFALQTANIISEPVVICTGDGCDVFTGAEKPPIDTLSAAGIIKTFWRQDQ